MYRHYIIIRGLSFVLITSQLFCRSVRSHDLESGPGASGDNTSYQLDDDSSGGFPCLGVGMKKKNQTLVRSFSVVCNS